MSRDTKLFVAFLAGILYGLGGMFVGLGAQQANHPFTLPLPGSALAVAWAGVITIYFFSKQPKHSWWIYGLLSILSGIIGYGLFAFIFPYI